ncbi:MAG: response regulator [Anaerolineae bacterium]|nr:response regulator [Anaerolineae bacterium]
MNKPLALIVEDDTKLSNIFSLALEGAGFETEVINDGAEATERLAAVQPAVVVLDLHLPNVSGPAVLQQIKSDRKLADTRVIVATADALMAESIQASADLVLLKPISIGQLRDLAARLRPPDTLLD